MAFVASTPILSARPVLTSRMSTRASMRATAPSRRAFLRGAGGALAAAALRASAVDTVDVEEVTEGTGAEIVAGATCSVKMHYTLTLGGFDGKVVDSSRTRGRPFSYVRKEGRGGVILGWDEGVTGMKVGGRRRIVVPSSKGYGERGGGPIPPGSTLYFDIELLGVGKA